MMQLISVQAKNLEDSVKLLRRLELNEHTYLHKVNTMMLAMHPSSFQGKKVADVQMERNHYATGTYLFLEEKGT